MMKRGRVRTHEYGTLFAFLLVAAIAVIGLCLTLSASALARPLSAASSPSLVSANKSSINSTANVIDFAPAPSALSAHGGRVHLHVHAPHRECTFLSSRHVKGLPARRPCETGIVIALPANHTRSARHYTFTVRARDLTTTSTSITVAAHLSATEVAPTIITQPVAPTGVAIGQTVTLSASASGKPAPTAQWQSSTNGVSWTNIYTGTTSSATSSNYTFVAAAADNNLQYRVVFSNNAKIVASTAVTLVLTTPAPATTPSSSMETSSIWSGYATSKGTFSSISASWTVASLSCTASNSAATQWVGIDGWGNPTVEQDGVLSTCANGTASYTPWYEMYGDPNLNGGFAINLSPSYVVSAGNVITATTSAVSGGWVFTISDATAHWSFSTSVIPSQSPAPSQSTAEWINEAPVVCNGQNQTDCSGSSLADFGTIAFSNATTTPVGGAPESIAAAGAVPLEMTSATNSSVARATPSALNATGNGFTDVWDSAN
jgi:hypothetical protein